MRMVFLAVLLCFSKVALAESADVKQLLNAQDLFRYQCTYDQVTSVGTYEDQAYNGPSESRQQIRTIIINESAVVAVKQLLAIANAETKKEQKIDPVSISCVRLR